MPAPDRAKLLAAARSRRGEMADTGDLKFDFQGFQQVSESTQLSETRGVIATIMSAVSWWLGAD